MLNNYICCLDIGSSKIAACVAEVRRKRIGGIFFDNALSKGVREGALVDSIDLVGSVGTLLKNLKAKSGINIKFVYVNISGRDIATRHSRAIVPLAERGNKVITSLDIQRVNEQARVLGSSLEEEIIHRIPAGYTIDSKSSVMNPLGLYSHRLEVDLYLVCAKLSHIQSLGRIINQAGYEIRDLFFSGVATSRVVFDKDAREGVDILCDIGSDNTELLIFKNGVLRDIEIFSLGGNDLTRQLQNALSVPFELAEDIKRSYGIAGDPAEIEEAKEILVKRNNLYKPIKQKVVSEVISSSAKLICTNIKEAMEKKVSGYEVDNFIVAGRTVLLEGFIEMLEAVLSVPVKLGRIMNPDIPASVKEDPALSGQKYLIYLTSLGMLCEALQEKTTAFLSASASPPSKNILARAISRFREVYQEYF